MRPDETVNLTNCDREPIHIPGSIQPHGCLLACDPAVMTIMRHSLNAPDLLALEGNPNGLPLADVIGEEALHTIRNALANAGGDTSRPALVFGLGLSSGRTYDVAVHRGTEGVIVEFEPVDDAAPLQPLDIARNLIGRIISINDVDDLVRNTSRIVRALLGYDRVMVYRFEQDGAGKVVSEAKRSDLESFLGQFFPAGDIPVQARALYVKNMIRIISDADCIRVALEPEFDAAGNPLDLSFAHLRSVSPVHCEYLRNMGVGASMSISVIVDGKLWGLIACHHYSPRVLAMAERVAAEMFGEFFSLHLNTLKQKRKLEAATHARASLDRFLRIASRTTDIGKTLRENLPDFARLMPCDGVGIWFNGSWTTTGTAPPDGAVSGIVSLAEKMAKGRIWSTHCLAGELPNVEAYAAQGAGMLVVPLSQRPRDYLFFFRKEIVHTLDWAGNPEKSYETGPLGDRLTPRKSFDIWKETVRLQSSPWIDEDRDIAEAVRAALVEIVLHHNELLTDERSKADLRQRMLNEELNHRVKNILAVIKSLITHPGGKNQTLENYVNALRGRIQALAFAHDQVVRSDGGGGLKGLLEAELSPYEGEANSIRLEGDPVWLDARAFSVMALMLHELSTNAAKYGALSQAGGQVTVAWSLDESGACVIEWKEEGGPEVSPPSRRGFGSVLIERSIPFDLGGESHTEFNPGGLHARFLIPGRHLLAGGAPAPVRPQEEPVSPVGERVLEGTHVLIVEDEMLIALDLEQILADRGVERTETAASVEEALARLENFRPDAAILDVNLGKGTSAGIAEELLERGIPFAFATGYGDRSMLPERFISMPIVRKPYDAMTISRQLAQLIGRG